jgi:thiol:disulfide interchange protein DsbD
VNPRLASFVRRTLAAPLAALVLAAVPAHGEPVRTPNVEAELVAERSALVPGQAATVALRLKIRDRWHTYWQNPGDSGLPTTLDWKLPGAITAGPIQWPAPKALPAGPLINYGYEGEVFHLVDLAVPATLPAGEPVTLAARADWLVCEDTCIPEGADLALTLPVATAADLHPKWGAPIRATRDNLPRPLTGWTVTATGDGPKVRLALTPPAGTADPGTIRFFPFGEGQIEPSTPQTLAQDGSGITLTLPVANQLAPGFTRVAGVLTAQNGLAGRRAATIDVALTGSVVAGPKPLEAPAPKLAVQAPAASTLSLAAALAFAFGGGLLLNLMPCVFPVLSIKAMGFVRHHDARSTMHHEAIAYSVGVVLSFVLLALVLVALRAAGEELGWGFQLQSPAVVTALALLFFVLALNLSGLFEFGMFAPRAVAGWTAKNRTLDAFLGGVLAVVVASPCTAPFMGAALGYAITQPIGVTIAVFVALGLGMALPFAALAWFPGWRRRLPKPGPWMERVRQVLAFPLYATVAWLAWVVGAQVDNDAVLRLALGLVMVAFAAWAWRAFRGGAARGFALAAAAGLASAGALTMPLLTGAVANAEARAAKSQAEQGWQAFSPARVESLATAGRPVFVDFTAAWCVTCQVNKRLVLNDPDVIAAFGRRNVALVRADWTRRDPEITQALAALGRNGVPVYVLHRPGKSPLVLPEVLQAGMIHDALSTL